MAEETPEKEVPTAKELLDEPQEETDHGDLHEVEDSEEPSVVEVFKHTINLEDGAVFAEIYGKTPEEAQANLARVVMCLKSCAGIPDSALEAGAITQMFALLLSTRNYFESLKGIFPQEVAPLSNSLNDLADMIENKGKDNA